MKTKTLLESAIDGSLTLFIARKTLEDLKDKEYITMADIRKSIDRSLGFNRQQEGHIK